MAFAGRALQVSKRARELGYEQIELISPTSHISNVFKQHGKAQSISQIADSWLTETTRDRILQEYDEADYIYVHSDYTKQSFLDAGTHPDKIRTTKLVPNPRFIPPSSEIEKSAFRIVYVGRIDSSKGIHLLINAFKQIQNRNAELRIMGGWTSRAMKKYIQGEIRSDPRITVGPGDPLPILHRANVLVHPSFEDGFGYAPLEALCCGVPVIVTEDTGMKEFVVSGDNGFIVPSGEVQPIVDCLNTIDRQQLSFDAVKFRSQFYAE
jgi:glycosyltransferase involved in cell wall biosynthesis